MRPVSRHGARFVCVALVPLVLAAGAGSRPIARPVVTGWLTYGNTVTRTGDAGSRLEPSRLRPAWFADVDGMVTTQPLVARNVPGAGQSTVYLGVSSGLFEALAPNGYVRWSVHLGVIPQACPQLPTWGVTGTPVIDAPKRAVYVADAFGWLHALDLSTGRERAGWPVRLYDDSAEELIWGGLADVRGSIYAATGSYCDGAMQGKIVRVDLATRRVSSWASVPVSLGGGGGIWGWGGIAYSVADDKLFVVTGNAQEGGTNTGANFRESAGYGEQLVELTRDLDVVASSHPPDVPNGVDSDFVGSPVIVRPHGCGEVVAAPNKNGELYLWHGADVGAGPFAAAAVQRADFDYPLLTNPAYDASLRSFYVVTFTQLVRVTIGGDCRPLVTWRSGFGQSTLNSSPTIARGVVWVALSGEPASLLAYDAKTGMLLSRQHIGGMSFAAPTVVGGRLFEDGRHGFVTPAASPSKPVTRVSRAPGLASWVERRHGWLSRETGVFATDDGGRRWRRIFAAPAARVVRTSLNGGVISVGAAPTACNCATRVLWTSDGGRTWRVTHELGPNFAGRGTTVVWWSGSTLNQADSWPPRGGRVRSHVVATFPRGIADAAAIPRGVAVLLTDAGHGWDQTPGLALVRGGRTLDIVLPPARGDVLVVGLDVSWPRLTVHGVGVNGAARTATWRSVDGSRHWVLTQKSG